MPNGRHLTSTPRYFTRPNVLCFAQPPGAGTEVHFDTGHVIIIQLEGKKKIAIGKSQVPYPIAPSSPGAYSVHGRANGGAVARA